MSAMACDKCGEDTIVVDPAEGFMVCEVCGYMPEPDAQDLHFNSVNPDGQQVGVFVPHGSNVAVGAGLAAGQFRHLAPKADTGEAHRRYLQERSKHFASSLKLPKTLHLEAQGYLLDVMTTRPVSKAQYVDVAAACCVYATARIHEQPLLLAEVASFLQQDIMAVGQQFRAVAQLLQLQVPPVSCPALIVKAAAACSQISGPGAASLPALRTHRAVKAAERILEWAKLMGYFAGRTPSTFSAAVLLVALEGLGLAAPKGEKEEGKGKERGGSGTSGAAAAEAAAAEEQICTALMVRPASVGERAREMSLGLVKAAQERGVLVVTPGAEGAVGRPRRFICFRGRASGLLPAALQHIDLLLPGPATATTIKTTTTTAKTTAKTAAAVTKAPRAAAGAGAVAGRKSRFSPSVLKRGSSAQGASSSAAASSSSSGLPSNKRPRRLIPALAGLAESLASAVPPHKNVSKDGRDLLLLPASLRTPSSPREKAGEAEEEGEPFRLRGSRNHSRKSRRRAEESSGHRERQREPSLRCEIDGDGDDPEICDQELDSYICSAEEVELRSILAGRGPNGAAV